MKKFNLSKQSGYNPKIHDKMLQDNRTDFNRESPDVATELQLEHKDNDSSLPFETQLNNSRKESKSSGILENRLNTSETLYNEKRTDKAYKGTIKHTDLIAEANDQKKYEAYRKAEKTVAKNATSIWDAITGTDVNTGVKIKGNVQRSQLQNNIDRLKSLSKTQPISEKASENTEVIKKDDKFYKLVSASLKDADAMLFHIYANAANRKLTSEEELKIHDINSAKARIIKQLQNV